MKRFSILAILLFFLLLSFPTPAAAMPTQLISDDDTIENWKVEERTGTVNIIPLEAGAVRFQVSDGGKVRLAKSFDLTGVDQITFKIKNFDAGGKKCPGYRFAFWVDGGGSLVNQFNLKSDWKIDTRSFSGYHQLEFLIRSPNANPGYAATGLEIHDFSIIANTVVPQPSSIQLAPDAIKPNEQVTATIAFTSGDRPAGDVLVIDWGDETPPTTHPTKDIKSPITTTHTYTQEGIYTLSCKGHNRDGGDTSRPIQAQIHVISAKISATPKYSNPGGMISFSANVQDSDEVIWDFGDGDTSTETAPQHTYEKAGTYTVKLTVKNQEGKAVSSIETIRIIAEYLKWDKLSYDMGETATITWDLLPPETANTTYQIFVFRADEEGRPLMDCDPVWSSDSIEKSGNLQISLSPPSFSEKGRYVACVAVNGMNSEVRHSIMIKAASTPTPNTTPTPTPTPTQSQTQPTPTPRQTSTPQASKPTIDSSGETGDTSITFRVLNKHTGTPISGATITVIGEKAHATSGLWGIIEGKTPEEMVIGKEWKGITNADGEVTITMFQNVTYKVTARYALAKSFAYQPSAINMKHTIRLQPTSSPPKLWEEDSQIGTGDTPITFQVLEDPTGTPLSGATIRIIGRDTSSKSGMFQWKTPEENAIGMELRGITNANGEVMFVLFRNVRYEVSAVYDITEYFDYRPSTTDTEHLIRLDIYPNASQTQKPTIHSAPIPTTISETQPPDIGGNLGAGDTYITFRVLDKHAGTLLSGVEIKAVGKKATNPVAWFGQMAGQAWGEKIIGTELSGTTDVNGVVTFAMLRNVRYEITAKYLEITESFAYQPSATDTEHLIHLNIQKATKKNPSQTITTNINTEPNAIIVNYEDTTNTTTSLDIIAEEQKVEGKYTIIDTRTINAPRATERFTLTDPSGKSYRITLKAESSIYGTITRTYATTFPGPLVKIGIPDSLYIYLVVFILLTFGAIGTQTTAPIVGICVCFLGWLFYFFGWLFALGSIAPIALGFATVIAILYYIRTRQEEVG